jgi:hypothetical protein
LQELGSFGTKAMSSYGPEAKHEVDEQNLALECEVAAQRHLDRGEANDKICTISPLPVELPGSCWLHWIAGPRQAEKYAPTETKNAQHRPVEPCGMK